MTEKEDLNKRRDEIAEERYDCRYKDLCSARKNTVETLIKLE